MPHYHQLLQKGKPIDIKQSAATAKTEARSAGFPNETSSTRRGEEPRVSGFRLDDASKKTSTKEESLGTTFDSARRHLLKTIGESYQSKESLNSLARSSRGKELLSQFDSEQLLKAKEAASSRFLKPEPAPGTQSLECRPHTNTLTYMSHKDLEKKTQSTGYSLRGGPDNPDKQPDPEAPSEARRAARASRSPIRDPSAQAFDKEAPGPRTTSRQALANSQLDNMSAKNSQKTYEQPNAQPTHASNLNGYLDRFQRKRMHNEEKTPLEAFRKSGLNFPAASSRDTEQRRDPILDVFLQNNKPRTDSNPKNLLAQPPASRPLAGNLDLQPDHPAHQHPKKTNTGLRDSRLLLPGAQPDRRTPVLESIMKKVPVSRKEDLLVTSRQRQPLEEQENCLVYPRDEDRHPDPSAASKQPLKSQTLALAPGIRAGPSNPHKLRLAQTALEDSNYKPAAPHRPLARQSQDAQNLKRSPSGNGGFNIKIDIGNLSSKMMANIQRDLP